MRTLVPRRRRNHRTEPDTDWAEAISTGASAKMHESGVSMPELPQPRNEGCGLRVEGTVNSGRKLHPQNYCSLPTLHSSLLYRLYRDVLTGVWFVEGEYD